MIFTRQFYVALMLLGLLAWLAQSLFSRTIVLEGLAVGDLTVVLCALWDYGLGCKPTVQVSRGLEPRLSIGRGNRVTLTIVAPEGKQGVMVAIHDRHPADLRVDGLPLHCHLLPGTQASLNYWVYPHRRGVLAWGQLQVQQRGRWGWVWRRWAVTDSEAEVKVYPDLVALRDLTIRLALEASGGMRQRRRLGLGTEFAELRDYDRGDDPRLIDWKATARKGKPLVRVLEPEQEQSLLIFVDGGRLMTAQVQGLQRFDWGLNAALALATAGLHRGDRVGIGVFDRTLHTWVPAQRGQSHFGRILDGLTPVQPTLLEPDYLGAITPILAQQPRRALVVIITDLVDTIASSELLATLVHLTPRYLPFCVTLRDPQMDTQAHQATADLSQAYGRAVALDLLEQRAITFAQLKQQGVLVLDAPAHTLSQAVVDNYLQLKQRNRL